MNSEVTVIVKFINGDQVIARLLNQTPDGILLFRPITLKSYPMMHNGVIGERLTTSVFCPVSLDESFVFDLRHCLFINRLHPNMVHHYEKLSEDLYSNLSRTVSLDPLDEEPEESSPEDLTEEIPKDAIIH